MRRPPTRQLWHTFPFWFFIFSGVGLTIAWQLDALPGSSHAPTSTADSGGTEELQFPAAFAPEPDLGEPESLAPGEALIAGQSEPVGPAEASATWPKPHETHAPALPPANSQKPSPFSTAEAQFHPAVPAMDSELSVSDSIQTASLEDFAEARQSVTPASATELDHKHLTPAAGERTSAFALPSGHDFTAIDALIEAGQDVDANFELSNLYWKQPHLRPQLMPRLQPLSHRIYFQQEPHYMDAYEVQAGDVLQTIAKGYHVPWQYLAKLNRTPPERIRPGQMLKVIEGPFSAVVDLSDFEITIHAHGHFVACFPVGIGQDGTTPQGKFTIQEKLVDPTYYGPQGVVAHNDPKNPLGEFWLDLGDSYGIHGTIDPDSIGKAESQGCIRLSDADIAAVYDLLGIGSEVIIRP